MEIHSKQTENILVKHYFFRLKTPLKISVINSNAISYLKKLFLSENFMGNLFSENQETMYLFQKPTFRSSQSN